ncbi:MAG: OB-fold domain-containing protein, partial [Erythrobacter sp.]|jgi:uncharacterized OB-fold protein|nr:OB-fold domain-containing protein [Erythrobacter sp.]
VGGRHRESGEVVFPLPEGDAGGSYDSIALPRIGTLWSWTRQDFRPKSPPYDGPEPFVPFLIGYVDLGEVIVESRIEEASLDQLTLGMEMELDIVQFDSSRSTFAFRPVSPARQAA